MSEASGVLYIVATPIGNLADISQRAVQVLAQVNLVAAEDTRHSQKLLRHLSISTPMIALHDHNERDQVQQLIQRLSEGESIALISDAGTPLISDPGYQLVARAHAEQIKVTPIPGPSAVIAGLSVAGLPTDRFVFEGFLPAKSAARRTRLTDLVKEPRTMVFYEAPHRILATVTDFIEIFGASRRATLAREITKLFETVKQASLQELADWLQQAPENQKGECVLMIAGAEITRNLDKLELDLETLLATLLGKLSVKDTASMAAKLTGLNKNQLYKQALALQQPD